MRDFQVEHDKRMHLIVVRRDLTGFAHLHPTMSSTGMWSVPLTLPQAGSYRVFADFKRAGRNHTLARDLKVPGSAQTMALAPAKPTATTTGGYTVAIDAATPTAGSETMLSFAVSRAGRPITPEPYLGARGHLVALREGDLAYLHVHPTEDEHETKAGEFETKGRGARRQRRVCQHVSERRPLPPVLAVQASGARPHRRLHPGGDALITSVRRG